MAYALTGEGPPLLVTAGWVSHLQLHWDSPAPRRFWETLSQRHTLVRYDKPGTGLSDRNVTDLSLEARVADVEALVEHLGLERFDFLGWSEGGPTAIVYADRHPERVGKLVIYGSFATWPHPKPMMDSIISIVRTEWGIGSAALSAAFVPSNDPEQVTYFTELQRAAASREEAARMLEENVSIDISEEASRLQCPTLIIHREGDLVAPVDAGRKLAALVPDVSFVQLTGNDHIPWWGDSEAILRAVGSFLGDPVTETVRQPADATGPLRTILFTDLVGHTEMMSRLGDERGRAVLREHERITREVLKANGGTEVKTMGDGFMASFGSVTKAVECAIALQRAFADREGEPLAVRVGLNAGEPIEEDGDLFGATVILASRIAAKAHAGEILVADTVRGLCSGKGFLFADRGEFVAKGIEEPVRISEVNWRE
jgi:class 3 adenylate cyclase/dienelactone hydrolase